MAKPTKSSPSPSPEFVADIAPTAAQAAVLAARNDDEHRAFYVRAAGMLTAGDRDFLRAFVRDTCDGHPLTGAELAFAFLAHRKGAAVADRVLRDYVDDVDRDHPGRHFCRRCAGTGRFITRMENGQPKGPGGTCFRCGGKGYHDQADRRRNDYRDRHQRVDL